MGHPKIASCTHYLGTPIELVILTKDLLFACAGYIACSGKKQVLRSAQG
jgi:hypothetical protein